MNKPDIRPDHFKIIQDILNKHLASDVKVWVYGSRAKWTTLDSSDLDLALEGPVAYKLMKQLSIDFENSNLPYEVDLKDITTVQPFFKKIIDKDKVLFDRFLSLKDALCAVLPGKLQKKALPKGWKEVKLGDVADINPLENISKNGIAKKVLMDDLTPFERKISNYNNKIYRGGSKFRNGDILLARITPCLENGKIALVDILEKDEVGFGSTEFIVIRNKPLLTNNYFLFYFSISSYFKNLAIKSMTGSSGRQRVQIDEIMNIKVSLPPLPKQKTIAQILSSLDDKIEINRQINKVLEGMAQAIFRSWFVDFDPVYAKKFALEAGLSKQQAEQAAMAVIAGVCSPQAFAKNFKEMNAQLNKKLSEMNQEEQEHLAKTALLFPSDLEESPLGPIPKSWSCKAIKEVANIVCGKTPSKKIKTYFSGKIPFIRIPDMYNKTFVFNTEDSLTEEGRDSQNTKTIPPKSICVSCIATVGLVSINATESQTNQQINSIIPKKIQYLYFVYLFMKSPDTFTLLKTMASGGTATMNLNTKDFSNIKIRMLNEDLISKFHNLITPLFDKIFINQLQSQNLEKIRDALLPKLLSGDINTSKLKLKDKI